MAAVLMFQSYQLSASAADTGRLVSLDQPWIKLGIRVASVTGTPSVLFKLQWSDDNATWTDDATSIATVTAAGVYTSGPRTLQGFYWRITATLTGTGSVVCTAGAIY
ncbi:hypothetical protein SPF06_01095 [Sinomonas sp. JGH33]|uniref:Ig-like domain-containing protein n=1 Tax=Sinomonas terricola TaxID=3110330 RepID=A0ABU5T0X6_9MICC|nr:hypothetical protein [Sinomonas sp. JGH33]MEA5453307.1 hypothetical protein [Sinomonas sp. JGH33]